MKISRKRVGRCVGVLLLGTVLVLAWAIWQPFEPRYQGKRLSAWAADLALMEEWQYSSQEDWRAAKRGHDEAVAAIRQIGTRAIPLALRDCAASDSELVEKWKDWAKQGWFIRYRLPSDYDHQKEGVAIFQALGPEGKPAITELIELFRNEDQGVVNAAVDALNGIGPDAISLLIEALTNSDARVRSGAAKTLAGFPSQATAAVAGLIQCLRDQNPRVRSNSTFALGLIGGGGTNTVVSALLASLKDKDLYTREMSALSLGRIHQNPERSVPALLACMEAETSVPMVPPVMVSALGHFGTNASAFVPALIELIDSNRFGLGLTAALNALREIDPVAAEVYIQNREARRTNRVAHPP